VVVKNQPYIKARPHHLKGMREKPLQLYCTLGLVSFDLSVREAWAEITPCYADRVFVLETAFPINLLIYMTSIAMSFYTSIELCP